MRRFLLLIALCLPLPALSQGESKPAVSRVTASPTSCTTNVSPAVSYQGRIYRCVAGTYAEYGTGSVAGAGGDATEVQFNNGGALAGADGLTYNLSTGTTTFSANATVPSIQILKVHTSTTAGAIDLQASATSASNALLMSLRSVAGTSILKVDDGVTLGYLTAGRVPILSTGGRVTDSAKLLFDAATQTLELNDGGTTKWKMSAGGVIATYGSLHITDTTPSATNFTLGGTSLDTLLNAPQATGSVYLRNGGNENTIFRGVASAVNYLEVTNAATGNRPKLAVVGADANIGISISAKGTGIVEINNGTVGQYRDVAVRSVLLNNSISWSYGSGSPEGVVTAPVGSIYSRTDGGAGTSVYFKESGSGSTGWVAK